jgi:hypothetical protein
VGAALFGVLCACFAVLLGSTKVILLLLLTVYAHVLLEGCMSARALRLSSSMIAYLMYRAPSIACREQPACDRLMPMFHAAASTHEIAWLRGSCISKTCPKFSIKKILIATYRALWCCYSCSQVIPANCSRDACTSW